MSANTWTKSPAVERTLLAYCKLVFTFIRLNSDSTGCMTVDAAHENESPIVDFVGNDGFIEIEYVRVKFPTKETLLQR